MRKLLIVVVLIGVVLALLALTGSLNFSGFAGTNTNDIFDIDQGNSAQNNGNPAAANGNNGSMVGGGPLSPCVENTAIQIEPLVENNSVVPNAFMGLDLNRAEVGAGLRYVLTVPADTYIQYFEAWSGQTWEAVGPTTVTATAWTSWCQNAGWLNSVGFNAQAGKHRQLNANKLPEPVGSWVTR